MKQVKLFLLGAVSMLGIYTANAQNGNTGASFGVKGGVNFSTVTGDSFKTPDSRTSFHVGVLAEVPLSQMFSIQAEALYSGQGFDYDFEGPDGDNAEYQLDYINVPLLAKVYIVDGLSIEAGPQFSFLVNDEIDFNPNADDGDIDLEGTPAEANSFDFGVAAGVTFQTRIGLFASGRYTVGLTDVVDNYDVKNSVFQLGIGFKF